MILYRIYCKKTNEWKARSTYGWQKKEASAKNWSSLKLAQNCRDDWNKPHYRGQKDAVIIKYQVVTIGEVE